METSGIAERSHWYPQESLPYSWHSMGTERAVSHYSMELSNPNLNAQIIDLNGAGTASFDPRTAVCAFLEGKGRRMRGADPGSTKTCFFKFFREAGNV